MYAEKLEATEDIIRRLFDPRLSYKRAYIPLEVKMAYLQHFLEGKWPEIVGTNLARSCSVEKIVGHELHIRTANSMLANELYMMQSLFLQKINAFLGGRVVIKKVYFNTNAFLRRQRLQQKKQEREALPPVEYTTCPRCGARMRKGLAECSICEREQREALRSKLGELLRIQPWLKYEDCLAYYQCDKIVFTAVKDGLKNFYFEKVRLGYASPKDSHMAVMLLTEKHPEEITDAMYKNALEYLRRDQSVSAFGSRLYGKKQ